MSGIPFPRGTGLVTRCATELRMKSAPSFRATATTSRDGDPTKTLDTVAGVERAIAQFTKLLCDGRSFSTDSIVIELAAPNVPNLTVINLPGIVRTSTAAQTKDVMTQVDKLLRRYMKKTSTIMLVVVPSNQDIATVGGLELATEYDPEGVRTMGVLTKPDLISAGAERNAVAVLRNETKPLRLGYVMVKNRTQADIDGGKTLAEAHDAERAYFASHAHFGRLARRHFTVTQLKEQLSALLAARIRTELPRIRAQIDEQLARARADLARLGPGFDLATPAHKAAALAELLAAQINDVVFADGSEYDGGGDDAGDDDDDNDGDGEGDSSDDSDGGSGSGGRSSACIYTRVHAAFMAFQRLIFTRPPDDEATVRRISAQQKRFQGEELPGFPSFSFFRQKTEETVAEWHAPAQELVQRVHDVLAARSTAIAAAQLPQLPALREQVVRASAESAEESMQRAYERVRIAWEDECSQPLTVNDDFMKGISAKRVEHFKSTLPEGHIALSNGGKAVDAARLAEWAEQLMTLGTRDSDTRAARDMLDLLVTYWDIAARRYTDCVCRALQCEMLETFGARLSARLAALRADAAAVERLLAEEPLVHHQRSALQACPYAEDAPAAVRKVLTAKIKGQSLAVDQIVKAFESWQFQRKAGLRQPLVLALTGQTGVGKTETAWQVAEALLTKRQHGVPTGMLRFSGQEFEVVRVLAEALRAKRQHGVPKGMLRFCGQDFADVNNVARYHDQIRRQLADVLVPCAGHAVVLFDELQKVAPGTLDVLVPALENRPMLTLPRGRSYISVDCSNLVVLLVSDIGAAAVRGAILPYARREDVPPSAIMPAVQRALDRQWKHLSFGKVVDWVIPYLPMRRQEVYEVLLLKWRELESQLLELRMAAALLVTEALTWELTGRAYVAYGQFTYRAPQLSAGGPQGAAAGQLQGTPVGESPPRMTHVFSVYGARVESSGAGPIEYLRGLFMRIDASGRSQDVIHVQLVDLMRFRPVEVALELAAVELTYASMCVAQDVIHAQLVDLGPERVAELHWCPQGYAAGLSREQLNSHVAVQLGHSCSMTAPSIFACACVVTNVTHHVRVSSPFARNHKMASDLLTVNPYMVVFSALKRVGRQVPCDARHTQRRGAQFDARIS
ncbi:P-loop containing nucleoside triphosphate hydrolase protein [Tribonema minus]|uniref:P-loop containing nucleoside triphosphate hydrolase protein n=1 Tax=Tribonema minus TaxID=303371 RepID=A0A836C741_9STRA|nr:P-loop containing nucleoside triphosphate hydrolase protein [Tribonema minus]